MFNTTYVTDSKIKIIKYVIDFLFITYVKQFYCNMNATMKLNLHLDYTIMFADVGIKKPARTDSNHFIVAAIMKHSAKIYCYNQQQVAVICTGSFHLLSLK